MDMKIIKIRNILIFITLLIGLNACYYDNVENLYPTNPDCDTTNVSYANDVWPVINTNCTSCHSGVAASGNVNLENYNQIKTHAQSGALLGSIKHENNWSPMPKGGNMLPDCNIMKIEAWTVLGYPDN